jgi:glycosyltransferase involved in cell wall biosynthesis
LLTPRDVDGLAIALIELLATPAMRFRLSDAGRSFILNFAWDAIAKAHVEIYQKISINR